MRNKLLSLLALAVFAFSALGINAKVLRPSNGVFTFNSDPDSTTDSVPFPVQPGFTANEDFEFQAVISGGEGTLIQFGDFVIRQNSDGEIVNGTRNNDGTFTRGLPVGLTSDGQSRRQSSDFSIDYNLIASDRAKQVGFCDILGLSIFVSAITQVTTGIQIDPFDLACAVMERLDDAGFKIVEGNPWQLRGYMWHMDLAQFDDIDLGPLSLAESSASTLNGKAALASTLTNDQVKTRIQNGLEGTQVDATLSRRIRSFMERESESRAERRLPRVLSLLLDNVNATVTDVDCSALNSTGNRCVTVSLDSDGTDLNGNPIILKPRRTAVEAFARGNRRTRRRTGIFAARGRTLPNRFINAAREVNSPIAYNIVSELGLATAINGTSPRINAQFIVNDTAPDTSGDNTGDSTTGDSSTGDSTNSGS